MCDHTDSPVILPMSNPTTISEADPAELMAWTKGKALIATGSPFAPIDVAGRLRRIGQANNVFVFPGIGLGAIAVDAGEITDAMIGIASTALADALTEKELAERCLMPEIPRLWDVCGAVATAVGRQAVDDGVAVPITDDELARRIADIRWRPEYPRIVCQGQGT